MSTERNKSYPMKKQHDLEREFARRLLESDENRREQLYRECYNKMHEFYLKHERSEGKFLYRYPSLESARAVALYLLYASILKIVGTNKEILEIGCGEGFLSIALARMGNRVIGIDVSDVCILHSERNKRRLEVKNVAFTRMDGRKLDFPSNHFDWIVSIEFLEHLHLDDLYTHLKEVRRVMRGDGCYLSVSPHRYTGPHGGGLHLKEYTYSEIEKSFNKTRFYVKTLLFLPFPKLFIPIGFKQMMEELFKKFKIPNPLWYLVGLGNINIFAYKRAHS